MCSSGADSLPTNADSCNASPLVTGSSVAAGGTGGSTRGILWDGYLLEAAGCRCCRKSCWAGDGSIMVEVYCKGCSVGVVV